MHVRSTPLWISFKVLVLPSGNLLFLMRSQTLEDAYALFCVKSTCYGHDCSSGLMVIHAEPSNRTAHAAGKLNALNPQVEDIPEDYNSRNPAKNVSLTHEILGPR